MAELLRLDNVERVLQEYAVEFRNMYQDNLIRSDRIASGELLNSVESRVEIRGTVYEVQLLLADYWKYVEDDTRPHWPPKSAILKWIQMKPVLPRPGTDGKIPTPESLAFLIGRKISRSGTRGSHDLERTKETMNRDIQERLQEAFAIDVSESFAEIVTAELL